jgi:hypothetical protein
MDIPATLDTAKFRQLVLQGIGSLSGGGAATSTNTAVGPDGVTRVPLQVNADGELKVNVEASINADLTLIEGKLDTIIGIETPQAADVSAIKTKLNNSIAVTGAFYQATQPVSIATMPTTPVTGTFFQATQPVSATALPLPSGASTSALQTTANTSLANLDVALSTRLKAADTLAGVTTVGSVTTLPAITGTVTANAGTNLNTSALALESGGNLAAIVTNTGKIPSKGTATIANSTPVNIASDQTVPVSGTVTANTGLAQPLTDTQLRATAVPVSGTVTANTGLTQPLTDTQLRATAVPISGTVTANTGLSQPLTDTQLRAIAVPVSGTISSNTKDGSGTAITSTTVSSKQGLDVNIIAGGGSSVVTNAGTFAVQNTAATPAGTNFIGSVNPDSTGSGSVTTSVPFVVTVTNSGTLAFQSDAAATGTVTIEASVDGTAYTATTYTALTSGNTSSSFNAATATIGQIDTSGFKNIRFRSNTIVGTVGITYNLSKNVSNVMLDNPLPAGTNAIGSITNTAFTANAGTNLNTSALALESGGNLATVATKMSDGTQTAKIVIPSAFVTGQAKIATTGTAVQLAANTLTQGVLISSLSTNAASITIGTSSSVTNTVDGTGNGSILTAGSTKSIAATNTNLVWINGTAGDIISFIGS